MDELTVLVVADGYELAQELNLALRRRPVTVLGPVFDVAAARDPLASSAIDVVVVDLDRADGSGYELLSEIHRLDLGVRILGSSRNVEPAVATEVLMRGGCGLLPRHDAAAELISTLRIAVAGGVALTDGHLASVIGHLAPRREDADRARITAREREVLTMLAEGHTTGEIAVALGISTATAQAHVKNVLAKLHVHSQVEAMRVAWRLGLVAVPASA